VLYALLREAAGVALRWYYAGISVRGRERIPQRGALLVVGNHPNALVDALLIGWAVPRRLRITAKATIFANPLFARFLHRVGVIPLRRVSDETSRGAASVAADPSRNAEAFGAVVEALENERAVLIFPEGKSHDDPTLAPMKTGPARMALQALRSTRVPSVSFLPVGLVFERKEALRSHVLVEIGDPFDVSPLLRDVDALTSEIDRRLRAVTLNYPSWEEAAETRSLAALFNSLIAATPGLGDGTRIDREVDVARRVDSARRRLATAPPPLADRVAAFLDRLRAFGREIDARGIAAEDVGIAVGALPGARFAMREISVLALAGPVAVWGRVNHWIPFTAARSIARRDLTAQDQPAMRTIVAGFIFVVVAYAVQTALVWWLAGGFVAGVYLVTLPVSADVDLRLQDRIRRAKRRMRSFFALRADRAARARLREEQQELGRLLLQLESELAAA
jgi:glycerol-3-phosphate O-acyltransferase / dihydroxyacetone phosphate acyltransferase